MRFYTVHDRPGSAKRDPVRPDPVRPDPVRTVFIEEGFSWFALLLPLLWAIYHRLWLVLLGMIIAMLGVGSLAGLAGLGEAGAAWATLVLQVLIAFEANDLRRWTLARNGYRLAAVVSGATLDAAERNFFAQAQEPPAPNQPAAPVGRGRIWPKPRSDPGGAGNVLGLFPRPATWFR